MSPPRGTATMPAATRAERLHGIGGSRGADAGRQAFPHAAGAALLALAVAAVAALAPTLLLDNASAWVVDDSLDDFNESATLEYTTNGNDSRTITNYTYYLPRDLAVDASGRLIIADTGPAKNPLNPPPLAGQRVVVLNDDYTFNNTIGIYGNRTADGGQFDGPWGVAVNSTGHIFVVEQYSNRTQIFNPDGTYLAEFNRSRAMLPAVSSTPDNRPEFADPLDVAISPDDKLIYLTAKGGTVYMVNASTYKYDGGLLGGLTTRTQNDDIGLFVNSYGMDFGAGGLLAVSDDKGYVVSVFDPADSNKRLFEVGTFNMSGNATDLFDAPTSVSFSNDGNLLAVVDGTNFRVQVFQLNKSSDGRVNNVASRMPAFVVDYPSPFSPLAVEFTSEDRLVVGRIGSPTSILDVYKITLPAVKNVTATSNVEQGVPLTTGSMLNITVGFNTIVRVDTMGGMPFLELGTSGGSATYVDGNGTDTLQFSYTVRNHDTKADLEYDPATVLNLDGSTITAGSRNVTVLTDFTGLNGSSSLVDDHRLGEIDTDGPAVLNASSTNASGVYYRAGSSIEVVLNYSKDVYVYGPETSLKLNLNVDAYDNEPVFASYKSGNETRMLVFNYTVQPGHISPAGEGLRYAGADALNVDPGTRMEDMIGNPAEPKLPVPADPLVPGGINVDARPPEVLRVVPVSQGDVYRINDTVVIGVVFGEAVNVMGSPVLALDTTPARNATYVPNTDGDTQLSFNYMVQEGDSALGGLRYAGAEALSIGDGGSIMDEAGNTANLTIPGPHAPLVGIVVNGTRDRSGVNMGGSPDGNMDGGQNGTATCSITLASSVLNLDAKPGELSTVVNQTVSNNGTAPITSVVLEATKWYIDYTGEDRPAEDYRGLPASLTTMRIGTAEGAVYEALSMNGTADVSAGVARDGQVDLSFRLDLTGETRTPGKTLTQYVDYTAECGTMQ